MPFAILFVIFVVLVLVVRAQKGGRSGTVSRGLLARGIILQADQFATETSYLGQRFELRRLTLDVEVPGRAPYEVSITPRIPRIVEALPGATLDLRVDPSNPQNIEVVGPAGATDWIRAAAAVPGQTWAGPQLAIPGVSSLPKGCGTIVVMLIGMSLLLAAVLSFVLTERHPASPSPTHAAPPAHAAPPPHATPRSPRSTHPH
jgi:hypothetical protein